jgi:hypothetical protein
VVHRFAEIVAPSRLGRSFRWLLASSWVTNLGDGITLAAGPLLVASQTRNPLAVATGQRFSEQMADRDVPQSGGPYGSQPQSWFIGEPNRIMLPSGSTSTPSC